MELETDEFILNWMVLGVVTTQFTIIINSKKHKHIEAEVQILKRTLSHNLYLDCS